MEYPSIMRVSHLYEYLIIMWNQSFVDRIPELYKFGNSLTKAERDAVISLKNAETNKCARQLIASDGMAGCCLEHIWGVSRRLHNCIELLKHYDGEHYILLMTEEGKAFQNQFEFALLGLELTTGSSILLAVFPEENLDKAMQIIYPGYVSVQVT